MRSWVSERDGRSSWSLSPTALDPSPQDGAEVEAESGEICRLRAELAGALAEMETMKAVAEVSESTKAEAVAAVRRQCQEEVASLQAILKGEVGAASGCHVSPRKLSMAGPRAQRKGALFVICIKTPFVLALSVPAKFSSKFLPAALPQSFFFCPPLMVAQP